MQAMSAGFACLPLGTQPEIEGPDGGIAANSRHRCHIQDSPGLGTSTSERVERMRAAGARRFTD